MDSKHLPDKDFGLPGRRRRLFEDFSAGLSARTRKAYGGDLERLRRWMDVPSLEHVAGVLLRPGGLGDANDLVIRWKEHMIGRRLSPASINRHLAAVRSLVRMGRRLGLIEWTLDVGSMKSRTYKDTRGPTPIQVRLLYDAAREQKPPAVGARDAAIVRLLYDLGLRRGELHGLDLEHVRRDRPALSVLAKGQVEREEIALPAPTAAVLSSWLELRGPDPGPLFLGLAGPNRGRRLSGHSFYRIVQKLGRLSGVGDVRPHGLRHAAITKALDTFGGDLRKARAFSRHKKMETLGVYDDARRAPAAEVAAAIAFSFEAHDTSERPDLAVIFANRPQPPLAVERLAHALKSEHAAVTRVHMPRAHPFPEASLAALFSGRTDEHRRLCALAATWLASETGGWDPDGRYPGWQARYDLKATNGSVYVECGDTEADKVLLVLDRSESRVLLVPYCGGGAVGWLFMRGPRFKKPDLTTWIEGVAP